LQFSKLKEQAGFENYSLQQEENSSSSNEQVIIDTLPEPLVYANNKTITILAIIISIILIVLNSYLVVSLFF
jgi:Mn2+/Fe2+ NRAMP family transporter